MRRFFYGIKSLLSKKLLNIVYVHFAQEHQYLRKRTRIEENLKRMKNKQNLQDGIKKHSGNWRKNVFRTEFVLKNDKSDMCGILVTKDEQMFNSEQGEQN